MQNLKIQLNEITSEGVTATWEPVPDARTYRLLWSDRNTPAQIYKKSGETAGTSLRFDKSTHIPYYLKVQALDDSGAVFASGGPVPTPVERVLHPQLEELGRGLTAVCTEDGVFLSWRFMRGEAKGYGETGLTGADFVVYKNGTALAMVTDRTSYRDRTGTARDRYAVAAGHGAQHPGGGPLHPVHGLRFQRRRSGGDGGKDRHRHENDPLCPGRHSAQ